MPPETLQKKKTTKPSTKPQAPAKPKAPAQPKGKPKPPPREQPAAGKRAQIFTLLDGDPSLSLADLAERTGSNLDVVRRVKKDWDRARLEPAVVEVPLERIEVDERLQMREALDEDAVRFYAERCREGSKPPPIDLFEIDQALWLVHGYHRVDAATLADWKTIPAYIHRNCTWEEAIEFAAAANRDNPVPRTHETKRRSVLAMIQLHPDWGYDPLAAHCGVTRNFVRGVKQLFQEKLEAHAAANGDGELSTEAVAEAADEVAMTPGAVTRTSRAQGLRSLPREPGEDDETAAERAGQEFLRTIPFRGTLAENALEIFDRDALLWREARPHLDALKKLLPKSRSGDRQGWFEYLVRQFVRRPAPHAWLKCAHEDERGRCVGGYLPNADQCPSCHGRGYHG